MFIFWMFISLVSFLFIKLIVSFEFASSFSSLIVILVWLVGLMLNFSGCINKVEGVSAKADLPATTNNTEGTICCMIGVASEVENDYNRCVGSAQALRGVVDMNSGSKTCCTFHNRIN